MSGLNHVTIPKCPHHPDVSASPLLISRLIDLQGRLDRILRFTSGIRCPECNKACGGSESSSHLTGMAVDIEAPSSHMRYQLIAAALKSGFERIGIGKSFVHVDVDTTKDQQVLWLY